MDQGEFFKFQPPKRPAKEPQEFKVVSLRECPTPCQMQLCDTPERAVEYWKLHIASHVYFNPECECLVVLLLTTRKRIKGHHLVSMGSLNAILVHAREVFRVAVTGAAAGIILMHNHPSGEPQPSGEDIRVTRQMIQAGKVLGIEVVDHVIVASSGHCSLSSMGYFYD